MNSRVKDEHGSSTRTLPFTVARILRILVLTLWPLIFREALIPFNEKFSKNTFDRTKSVYGCMWHRALANCNGFFRHTIPSTKRVLGSNPDHREACTAAIHMQFRAPLLHATESIIARAGTAPHDDFKQVATCSNIK